MSCLKSMFAYVFKSYACESRNSVMRTLIDKEGTLNAKKSARLSESRGLAAHFHLDPTSKEVSSIDGCSSCRNPSSGVCPTAL